MPRQVLPRAHRNLAKSADQDWSFLGAWSVEERMLIEETLQWRVHKATQPAEDRWAFTRVTDRFGLVTYAAWQPGRMSPCVGYLPHPAIRSTLAGHPASS